MADTLKCLYNGTLETTSTSLYTVPTSTQTILKEIVFVILIIRYKKVTRYSAIL